MKTPFYLSFRQFQWLHQGGKMKFSLNNITNNQSPWLIDRSWCLRNKLILILDANELCAPMIQLLRSLCFLMIFRKRNLYLIDCFYRYLRDFGQFLITWTKFMFWTNLCFRWQLNHYYRLTFFFKIKLCFWMVHI